MIRIDFNKLIKDYDTDLVNNLRGFGGEKDYLKFWVPDVDNLKSFFNLIDALYESGEYKFSIYLKSKTFDEVMLSQIDNYLKKNSNFSLTNQENYLNYEIELNKNLYRTYKSEKKIIKDHEKFTFDQIEEFQRYKSKNKIEKIYLQNITSIKYNDYFSEKIIKNNKTFFGKIENFTLTFEIDDRITKRLAHNCKAYPLASLINIFFDICINKNIQEIADHAAIYLEEKIRLAGSKILKNGILLPAHAGTYFESLNILSRDIYKKYKKVNSMNDVINKNYFKKSFNWINLQHDEKFKKIDDVLKIIKKENFIKDESFTLKFLDNNFRVYLYIDKNFMKLQNKKNILLETEKRLKKIDDTLEVFVDEAMDKNKLRVKNSPIQKRIENSKS